MTRKTLLRGAAAAGLIFGLQSQTAAQEEQARVEDDQIVITAPGPDRAADELIGSATILDRDTIVQDLAGSLGDTLSREPGVASTFFGQGASRPVLRGLGAERVQVLTNGIGVIDVSAASQDHQVAADGIDAERIEILRGPAALGYGGQAIGGVVNVIDGLIVDALPDDAFGVRGLAAYNDVNEGTELAGRGHIVAGDFVVALSASARDFGDYDIPGFAESAAQRALEEAEQGEQEVEGEEEHGEEDEVRDTLMNSFLETQTLGAGVTWVGDDAFFGVAVRQQTAEYGLPGHAHEHEEEHGEEEGAEGEEHGEEEEENPFIDLEQVRVDVRGGVSLNTGVFTDLIGTVAFADYEHTEFEAPGEPGTIYENEGLEARAELNTDIADFKGAWGVQYTDLDFVAEGEEAFVTPTESLSYAVFAYQTREWDNGYGVEAGLRYEYVERDNAVFGQQSFDLFSGSFGAHQHVGDVFLGAQVAYTERAPNETELFADGAHLATQQFEIGDPGLDKEVGINLEGTARWSRDRTAIGVNVFVTEFSDFVFLSPRGDELDDLPVFLFLQDDATFVGGEVYATWGGDGPLGADWTFDGSVDYVQAELDDGGDVPLLPPLTFKADARATWGPVTTGLGVIHAAEQDNPGEGRLATDSYTLLRVLGELSVSAPDNGRGEAVLFVEARNLTDEEARVATSVLKDVAPLPGRNIRAGVRVRF